MQVLTRETYATPEEVFQGVAGYLEVMSRQMLVR